MNEMAIMTARSQECSTKARGSVDNPSHADKQGPFSSLMEKSMTNRQEETTSKSSMSSNKNSLSTSDVTTSKDFSDKDKLSAENIDQQDTGNMNMFIQPELFAILGVLKMNPQQVNTAIADKSAGCISPVKVDCQQSALSLAYLQKLNLAEPISNIGEEIPGGGALAENLSSSNNGIGDNTVPSKNMLILSLPVDTSQLVSGISDKQVPVIKEPTDLVMGKIDITTGGARENGETTVDDFLNKLSATEVHIVSSQLRAEQKLNYLVPIKDHTTVIQQAGMNLASQASYLILKPQTVEKAVNATGLQPDDLTENAGITFASNNANQVLAKKEQGLHFKNENGDNFSKGTENPQTTVQLVKFTKNAQNISGDTSKGFELPDETKNAITKADDKKSQDASRYLLFGQSHKVSENQVTNGVTTGSPIVVDDPHHIINQILDHAKLNAHQENAEMIIKLKPEHLGEITLKVAVENGLISASIKSANSEVRSIIEASLPQLKQELTNLGLKVDNVGVYSGLAQGFTDGQREQRFKQQSSGNSAKKSGKDFIEAAEAIDKIENQPGQSADGEVDYRI